MSTSVTPIKDCVSKFEDTMKSSRNNLTSGFKSYDAIAYGFPKGSFTVIASRPSMGKSAFADTIALNLALDEGKSVLYYSIEANETALLKRFVANVSGVKLSSLHAGCLNEEENKQINQAIEDLSNSSLQIEFTPEIEISQLAESIISTMKKTAIDIVFIDYLQLITAKGFNTPNREQEIGFVSRKLKAMAKQIDVPIVALSQLNRSSELRGGSKRPWMSDLRESGSIEQEADVVVFIHRPEYYGINQDEEGMPTTGIAEIIIGKNRHGEIGDFRLKFDKDTCKFSECEDGYYMESASDKITCNFTAFEEEPFRGAQKEAHHE